MNTIKKAKDICERFLEEGMFKGTIPAVPGIFNAKNNYGWVDRTEVKNEHEGDITATLQKAKARVRNNEESNDDESTNS